MSINEVTLVKMEALAKTIDDLRRKETEMKQAKEAVSNELEAREQEMIKILTDNEMKGYRAKVGLLSLAFRTSVRTPKTPEDRAAFFEYLKAQGLYDQMISVNSQTLNSFYKSKLDEAVNRGEEDFAIPGLKEVTISPTLSFRR